VAVFGTDVESAVVIGSSSFECPNDQLNPLSLVQSLWRPLFVRPTELQLALRPPSTTATTEASKPRESAVGLAAAASSRRVQTLVA